MSGRATALLIWPAPSKKASAAAHVRQVRLALRTPKADSPGSPCRNKAGPTLGMEKMVMPKGLAPKGPFFDFPKRCHRKRCRAGGA
ncbi:MAG: hypothetical protein CM15mP46_5350 [Alphaproteobacteria bacterium]|nr:MAG: hypothetical protein CM15mP46_5350 [Alphaproteobacteria bacterium]